MEKTKALSFMEKWVTGGVEEYARVHVTHFDLDGYGCMMMVDPIYPIVEFSDIKKSAEEIQKSSYDFRSILATIGDYKTVNADVARVKKILDIIKKGSDVKVLLLVSDFSFKEEVVKEILEENLNVEMCVIDHHQTCPEYSEMDRFTYWKDTNYCATMLLCQMLEEIHDSGVQSSISDLIKIDREIAEVINLYDLGNFGQWRVCDFKDVSEQMRLNLALNYFQHYGRIHGIPLNKIVGKLFQYAICLLDESVKPRDRDIVEANREAEKSWKTMMNEYERYIRTMIPFDFPGISEYGVLIPKPARNFFSIAKAVLEDYPEIPYVVGLYMESFTMSLCALREDINMGLAAKPFGGGGHPGAAGCTFQNVSFRFKVNGNYQTINLSNPDDDIVSEDWALMNEKLEAIKNGKKDS